MPLRRGDLAEDPTAQLRAWWAEAEETLPHGNEVALATATPDGRPSVRMVLVKQVDERGLVFFTNTRSRKAQELAVNPRAALLFHYPSRQVRVEGRVEGVAEHEADAYWRTRSPASRRSAVASPQSQRVPSRAALEDAVARVVEQHGDEPPRPAYWGGYRVVPDRWEFWQNGPDRLHDRFTYERVGDRWEIGRLAP